MYGQQFQLTFKGEKEFKTIVGALITFVVTVYSFIYFVQRIAMIADYGNTTSNSYTVHQEIKDSYDTINLGQVKSQKGQYGDIVKMILNLLLDSLSLQILELQLSKQ
ncbi:UNKNOWN [Stylonychia lemnae]|uniref:Uncharacterized protein n=1 Tax=Stylonychia lemnae TaxID=5949 RepID=A0A078A9M9_STYLE|nr:UNKNOWN [Stylonychia lemnae]|eukprot:CDW78884.1 UNKNOWN [Stylonychia lemnae]